MVSRVVISHHFPRFNLYSTMVLLFHYHLIINTSHLLPAPQPIIDLTQAVEASHTRTRTALVTLLSRVNN